MIAVENLEANITRQCNNRCAGCNHASPWAAPYFMEPAVLARDLAALRPILHTNFLCLQGGEPLLHPRLFELMDVISQAGVAAKCGILSNGQLFPSMPDDFWRKCADLHFEVRCSVYPNLSAQSQAHARAKAAEFGVDFRPCPIGAFVLVLADHPQGESFHKCIWRVCHAVHEGYFHLCALSPFWSTRFLDLPAGTDGIALEGLSEETLAKYMKRDTPFESCRRCTGGSTPWKPWHQCDTLEQWLKESTYEHV